jgi:glutaredoxin
MSLLKPIFAAEAQLQAAILGAGVDEEKIKSEIDEMKKAKKVLIYTYGLSPFSTEAVALLEGAGYEYTEIELGAEWFLLGPEASVTRVALSRVVDNGATSLPKVFIGGNCIGGCAELAALVENGDLEILMKKARVSKRGEGRKKSPWLF